MSTLGWEESIASIPFYPLWQMIVRIVLEAANRGTTKDDVLTGNLYQHYLPTAL